MSERVKRSRTPRVGSDARQASDGRCRVPVLRVDSPERWRVLLAPVRAEIVQALRCLGPSSVREVAVWTDRPADALYHHLRKLQENGFVQEVSRRKSGRHTEILVDVTADDFAIDFPALTTREQTEAICETGSFYLGTLAKAVRAAASNGELQLAEDRRNFVLNYDVTKLTPAQFRRARSILGELKAFLDATRPDQAGALYAVGFVMTPMTRDARREADRDG